MTCLAITELQINSTSPSQREKAFNLFKRSFQIDESNPLTLKHLADHCFFANQLDISESLTKRALILCSALMGDEKA
jgi:hypothetical protein